MHSHLPTYSAPAPIDVLYELRTYRPDLFSKMDILIDGGVKSGADVVKALALGAKGVGLGRAFLYANGTHGQEGVERLCESESPSGSYGVGRFGTWMMCGRAMAGVGWLKV
jgi:glutamate synthase domain-containing protein 2